MAITKDTSAPLVAVVGGTGAQGGSVIKALAESDKQYRIRAATRDTTKASAKALAEQGVEVVQADLSAENKEHAVKFFQGATYAFAVTQFWDHLSPAKEVADGNMLVDASKAAGVKRLIWSGLSRALKISNGKYPLVEHFDSKAVVTEHARTLESPGSFEVIDVQAGMYMSNFGWLTPPTKDAETGKYVITGPEPMTAETEMPFVNAERDYGLFVRKAIEEANPSKEIYAYGEMVSWGDAAKEISKVCGKEVTFKQLTKEEHMKGVVAAGMTEHVGKELQDMFSYITDIGYFGTRDIAFSKEGLSRPTDTFPVWAKTMDWSKFVK